MSVYDLHFNKDDVTIRNILVGLLATLHDTMFWYNQVGSKVDEKRKVNVPFYFSTTGTERYLQDNFLNNIDFDPENLKAETFYNSIPRGIVELTSVNIEASAIVNKYVRMFHQKQEDDGTLNTYNTEAYWVPIILNVDCKVYVDSILDQLKCTESLIRTFFKNKSYQVDVAYTRIPCLILFPEDYTNERAVEFSFTDKREFTTNFSLQIKTYIPIFKEETSIFAGTTMEGFSTTVGIPTSGIKGNVPNNGPNNSSFPQNPGNKPGNTGYNGPTTDTNQDGGTNMYGNNGSTGPSLDKTDQSQSNTKQGTAPNTPTWPINPSTETPPNGGTADTNQ
jgi:hypothetical protein